MKQGAIAIQNGSKTENIISCILSDRGYEIKRHYKICDSIYGHPIRIDFLILNIPEFKNGLAIECKWQDVGGSVDEKFPYLVLNIQERFPCPVIIVIDGGGQKEGSIQWLKCQVDGKKLMKVLNLSEFISYVNRDLPKPGAIYR
jgi:hypothetical protein